MKFWVSGATGFIGQHLVATLRAAGHDVLAVARSAGEVAGVEVHPVDILDADAVYHSALGCDGAFLAAGLVSRNACDAEQMHAVHVTGTVNALHGLRRAEVRRVVYVSTSGTIALGTDPQRVYSELDDAPLELIGRWPYYRSKLYGERAALAAGAAGEFDVICTNPSLVLGPGDTRGSSTLDLRRFVDRQIPAVSAGGVALVDVRDVAPALLSAFHQGRAGQRYLLSGHNLAISALFKKLAALSGVPAPRLQLPRSPALALGMHAAFCKATDLVGRKWPTLESSVELGQYFWYCNASKAMRELGFAPRDLAETLRDTLLDLEQRRALAERGSADQNLPPASTRESRVALAERRPSVPPPSSRAKVSRWEF